jgi:hypothetical protein
MAALTEGLGTDDFLLSGPPPEIMGQYAHALFSPGDHLATLIQGFYMAPHLYLLDPGYLPLKGAEDGGPMTQAQQLAWLTGAALSGGDIHLAEPPSTLADGQLDILKRLLPLADKPARPVDLFRNPNPQVWSLPLEGDAGQWHILGLFNWNTDAPETLQLLMAELGLNPEAYYTVYDFWGERFYGLSQEVLRIEVPPGSVRIIGLRSYEDRPMFLAHDRHFAQGALEYSQLTWDDKTLTLQGTFDAIADTDYTVRLYVPEAYRPRRIAMNEKDLEWRLEGPVLVFSFRSTAAGETNWTAAFASTGESKSR